MKKRLLDKWIERNPSHVMRRIIILIWIAYWCFVISLALGYLS